MAGNLYAFLTSFILDFMFGLSGHTTNQRRPAGWMGGQARHVLPLYLPIGCDRWTAIVFMGWKGESSGLSEGAMGRIKSKKVRRFEGVGEKCVLLLVMISTLTSDILHCSLAIQFNSFKQK